MDIHQIKVLAAQIRLETLKVIHSRGPDGGFIRGGHEI